MEVRRKGKEAIRPCLISISPAKIHSVIYFASHEQDCLENNKHSRISGNINK